MSTIHVCGGKKLEGSIRIQGSKNASLPVLAATLLTEGTNVFENCPQITDVKEMLEILRGLGSKVWTENGKLYVCGPAKLGNKLDKEHVISMRSSVILLGVLLSENGSVCMEYPGGCVIGKRPIDMHISSLEKLGCRFEKNHNVLCAFTDGIKGTDIYLPFPSVGTTENIILAAVKGKGKTVICGAAKEPEIIHLCQYLSGCGAKITGAGTDCIHIEGVSKLCASTYRMPSDRIVAGTYLMSAVAVKGNVTIKNAPVSEMKAVISLLETMGACIKAKEEEILVTEGLGLKAVDVETMVYPGFPTDLQSPLLVLMSQAEGVGRIKENIYENRFHIVSELNKMNSQMHIVNNEVIMIGPRRLKGKRVSAKELRGNAALIMAGLLAEGETQIFDCQYVKRGYEDICRDLRGLGANLYEIEDE